MVSRWCEQCGAFTPHTDEACLICVKPEDRKQLLDIELQLDFIRELHPEVEEE